MERKFLEVGNLCKYYGRSENRTKALDGISFQVFFRGVSRYYGEQRVWKVYTAELHRSGDPAGQRFRGCGRHAAASAEGAELAEYRGKKIGYLFQNFELLDNLTGRENILCLSPFTEFQRRRAERDWRS